MRLERRMWHQQGDGERKFPADGRVPENPFGLNIWRDPRPITGICVGGPCHGQVRTEPKLFFEVLIPVMDHGLAYMAEPGGEYTPLTMETKRVSYVWAKWWGELGSHLPVWVMEGSSISEHMLEKAEAVVGFLMNYRLAPTVDAEVETGAQVLERLGLSA